MERAICLAFAWISCVGLAAAALRLAGVAP